MRRRVRWGNVGRLAGGLALVALVVAWPRVAGEAPRVPDGVARGVEGAAGPAEAAFERRDRPPSARPGGGEERRERPKRTKRRVDEPRHESAPAEPVAPQSAEPVAPVEPVAPPPAEPVAPAEPVTPAPPPAPSIDPAELEFGFER